MSFARASTLMPGMTPRIGAVLLLPADRLVVEARAGPLRPGYTQSGKSFVAGCIAFIHRQQALVAGDHRSRSIY